MASPAGIIPLPATLALTSFHRTRSMTSGFKRPDIRITSALLTGTRAALTLAVSAQKRERPSLNIHAVLNLLNRLAGTEDSAVRDELIGRLADYMAAAHRVEAVARCTLSNLCELVRSYAAMRYLMADAIEPQIDVCEGDFSLRTEQSPEMMAFLQKGIDSLLADYTPRVILSLKRFAWWQVELTLSIDALPGRQTIAPAAWSTVPDGNGFCRSARFTAIAQPIRRT